MGGPLAGQVAVVTGAGKGIGRAIASQLARSGAGVCVVDVDTDAGRTSAETIEREGGNSIFVQADVGKTEDAERVITDVAEALGSPNILVNNAATFPRSAVMDISLEEWRRVLDVNLTGPFLLTKAVLPSMTERGHGRIVNVASGLGVTGGVKAAHYSSSKGGLISFTKCLARELARHGITANALVPGLTDTDMPRTGQTEEEVQALVEQIPVGRLATPDEVAAFLVFLVGPSCPYVTGQTLFVNGGWIMP